MLVLAPSCIYSAVQIFISIALGSLGFAFAKQQRRIIKCISNVEFVGLDIINIRYVYRVGQKVEL